MLSPELTLFFFFKSEWTTRSFLTSRISKHHSLCARDRKEADIDEHYNIDHTTHFPEHLLCSHTIPRKSIKAENPLSRAYCSGSCCYSLDVSSLRTVLRMLCEGWEEAHCVVLSSAERQHSLMIKSTHSGVRRLACESQLWHLLPVCSWQN